MLRSTILAVMLVLGAVLAPSQAWAADAEPFKATIPIEDFARLPKLRSVSFSPDGARFAAVQDVGGRMNLVAADLKSRKLTRVTNFGSVDVSGYRWIGNERVVFSVYDGKKGLAEQRGGGLFAVNWDGSEPKELSPTANDCQARNQICRQTRFLRRIAGQNDDIIALANERDLETQDVYRLNTKTGRKSLLTPDNPGKVTAWFLDKSLVPRAAWSSDGKTLENTFWYRDSASLAWRKVATFNEFAPQFRPVGFGDDGALYVVSNLEHDKLALYAFDPATGKPAEKIAQHPLVDIEGDLIQSVANNALIGLRVDADKPEVVWFDELYARAQKLADTGLPAKVNRLTPLDDGKVLVHSSSDRDPGTFYLLDPAKRTLEELLRPTDWLKPESMSAMSVLRYKARDGLEIPAYLTLPQGREAKKLPLVAWIHGGPWGRDEWGFDDEAQFFASRGYAVLQPNFRGSTGFGRKHFSASFKQWGQSMQDDITDGIRSLVEQGIVDAARVCIGGGSYGGYATMMGLVKDPHQYRCGINVVGVTDLIWMHELGYSDFNSYNPDSAEAFLSVAMGDLKDDRALLEQYSPRRHAERITAPVLFVHGAEDRRVPIKHAEGMRDALKSAGKPFEWVVYSGEGHGFMKPENRLDYFKRMEAFLYQHNPP
jgi:dipeptidyl aminopeptidase/acylaminoacyl peptidase